MIYRPLRNWFMLLLLALGTHSRNAVVALAGRHFAVSFVRGSSGRSIASQCRLQPQVSRFIGACRGGSTIPQSSFLSSTPQDNEEDNDTTNGAGQQYKPQPKTGWNHNLPSESSDFWAANGDGPSSVPTSGTTNHSNKGDKPRTGWLHNTKPTPQARKISKDQQQKMSQARQRLEQAMKEQERNHRMVAPPTFHACGNGRRVVVTEHVMTVPIYRNTPRSPRIDLFFTITEAVNNDPDDTWFQSLTAMSPSQRAQAYVQRAKLENADGMMLYLQGGPGFGSPTPMVGLGFSEGSSWAASALNKYQRIVLMDQRGTGRSTPITKQSLEERFPDLFLLDELGGGPETKSLAEFASSHPNEASKVEKAVEEATQYLAQFRADNIVLDAEDIKDALMVPTKDETLQLPWGCALGQSFGGFCMMTYLSTVKSPPRICLLTGGIGPILTPVYEAYTALWDRVKERSLLYYDMYPGDVQVVKNIVRKLLEEPAVLPSGGRLTARRFLQLGLALGGSPASFAILHSLFSSAFLVPLDASSDFNRAFLKRIDSEQSFDDHPIYYWMHESIYGDGPDNSPTSWAAHRAYEALATANNEFNYEHTSALDDDAHPVLFFGEMVFPWMAEDYQELSGVGMQAMANAIASKSDWGSLYNGDHMRKVLGSGASKAAAAVYHDDMYVDFDASMKVSARGGPLDKCKVWVNNDYQHSGLRDGGASIFEKLYGMATGCIRTPS